jgi:nucleotide sugar dehydrogenase
VFCTGDLVLTDARTAEMAKLTENSFRDVNIAFANELSVVCERMGIDVWELIDLANRHPRVNILRPGPGVGGHCIAVDPWFIVSAAPQEARLIRTARQVNDAKPGYVIGRVRQALEGRESPTVAALGLTFKADVDDLRQSPALAIVRELALSTPGAAILVVDPNVFELPSELKDLDSVRITGAREAIARAEVVLLLVEHREFRDLDPELLAGKTIIDTRGVWRRARRVARPLCTGR